MKKKATLTKKSQGPFRFQDLPPEIRAKIYPLSHNLQLPIDNSLPVLLQALIPHPGLFSEALKIYKVINFSIKATMKDEDQELHFKALPMKRLLQFRHLKLHWLTAPDLSNERRDKEAFGLRSHKVLLMNNFESLTLVFERGSVAYHPTSLTDFLMKASRTGVTELTIKFGDMKKMADIKERACTLSGSKGKMVERTTFKADRKSWKEEVWVWKSETRMSPVQQAPKS